MGVGEHGRAEECYDFGYTALQPKWHTEPASYYPKSEDCLTPD